MKPIIPVLLLVAACAGVSVPAYLQPGVPAAQARADLAQCRGEGRAVAPRRAGSTFGSGISIGVGVGRCTGNVCVGARTGDVFDRRDERRAERRGEAVGACMGRKGYRLVTLPACRGRAQVLASHPFDTTGLCVADGAIAAPL